MNTVVRGRVHPQRSLGYDTFADITDAAVVSLVPDRATGEWTVTFDRDIDPPAEPPTDHVAQVRDRMESRDDADQARRATLRAAASGGAANLAEMNTAYLLGDDLPDPIYP